MPAPVTPIKKQLTSSQGGLGVYSSGSMISISDSPSARYRNSPALKCFVFFIAESGRLLARTTLSSLARIRIQ